MKTPTPPLAVDQAMLDYFLYIAPNYPVLHRLTVIQSIHDKSMFAPLWLAIHALAARFNAHSPASSSTYKLTERHSDKTQSGSALSMSPRRDIGGGYDKSSPNIFYPSRNKSGELFAEKAEILLSQHTSDSIPSSTDSYFSNKYSNQSLHVTSLSTPLPLSTSPHQSSSPLSHGYHHSHNRLNTATSPLYHQPSTGSSVSGNTSFSLSTQSAPTTNISRADKSNDDGIFGKQGYNMEISQTYLLLCIFYLGDNSLDRAIHSLSNAIQSLQLLGTHLMDDQAHTQDINGVFHSRLANIQRRRAKYPVASSAYDEELFRQDSELMMEARQQWVQEETLRRLWWIGYSLDRYICLLTGIPRFISNHIFRVRLPGNDIEWDYMPAQLQGASYNSDHHKHPLPSPARMTSNNSNARKGHHSGGSHSSYGSFNASGATTTNANRSPLSHTANNSVLILPRINIEPNDHQSPVSNSPRQMVRSFREAVLHSSLSKQSQNDIPPSGSQNPNLLRLSIAFVGLNDGIIELAKDVRAMVCPPILDGCEMAEFIIDGFKGYASRQRFRKSRSTKQPNWYN